MEMWLGRQWQEVTRNDTSVGEERSTWMQLQYSKCSNANALHSLVPGLAVFGLRDSIFTHPLLSKYRISISATFPLLNVLDLLLSTIVSLLSVLGLLWHEIFRP
jgi:hypothetical protein